MRCNAIAFTVALARRLFSHSPSNSRICSMEKPNAPRPPNEAQGVDVVVSIRPVVARAPGSRRHQANAFVVADHFGRDPGYARGLSDIHGVLLDSCVHRSFGITCPWHVPRERRVPKSSRLHGRPCPRGKVKDGALVLLSDRGAGIRRSYIAHEKRYASDKVSTAINPCVTRCAGILSSLAFSCWSSCQSNWQRRRTPVPAADTKWAATT